MNEFKPFEAIEAHGHLYDILINRRDLMKHRNNIDVPVFFVVGYVNYGEGFLLQLVDDSDDSMDITETVDRADFEKEYAVIGEIDMGSRIIPGTSMH